jgi:hypothetical protein
MPDDDLIGFLGVCTRPGCPNLSWAGSPCPTCSRAKAQPAEPIGGPEVDPPAAEYRKDGPHRRGKLKGGLDK